MLNTGRKEKNCYSLHRCKTCQKIKPAQKTYKFFVKPIDKVGAKC